MSRLLLVLMALPALGAPPVLSRLEPWGGQRGKAVTLTLAGNNLPEGAKLITTLKAIFTPLTAPAEASGKRLPFLVEIPADTPIGLYPIRVESSNGISNILLFSVGGFPEIGETEGESRNDSIEKARPIHAVPVTVNGTLRAADRDFYQITGKAGEHRVFEVEARRMGSAIDPSLRLYDSAGKLLARVEDTPELGVDCRLDFTFPREGTYYVEVHDARFSDQTANFYRLKMGAYPYAGAMFPLGWTRNKPIEVEFTGGNLTASVKAKPANGMVGLPNSPGSLPMPFVESDLPEVLEPSAAGPHTLAPGSVMNGRILKPGEVDRYKLAVQPGKSYLVEVGARALGTSRLDALVTVYDAKGKKLESAGDQPPKQAVNAVIVAGAYSSDPFLMFQAPKDAAEVTVAIEDLNGNGGPAYAYRLLAREQQPDFEISLSTPYVNIPAGSAEVVQVNVERRGFGGDIALKVANLPAGVEAAGGSVPAEVVDIDTRAASRRGVITLIAKPGGKPQPVNLEVWGEATLPDGTKIRRKASGPGMVTPIRGNFGFVDSSRRVIRPFQAEWLGLDLPAYAGTESAGTLTVDCPPRVRIIQGMKYDFPWKFTSRAMGVQDPKNVAFDTPGGRDLRISNRGQVLSMNTTIGTPAGVFDMIVNARVRSGMREETVYAPAITVEVVQGYGVDAPRQTTPLRAGGSAELTGRVTREKGFTAPITVSADALPLGVSCRAAEIPESAAEYRIACQATAEAPAGEHKILLNPSSILPEGEKGKVPYKIAPVEAMLVIAK